MTQHERSAVLTGGCQCGAVRYALYTVPKGSVCHCRMCQKAVGGPFAALATIDRQDLAWTAGTPALFESSSIAKRGFCARCGTPLTYEGSLQPARIEITIGSLDDPARVAPVDQYGVESRGVVDGDADGSAGLPDGGEVCGGGEPAASG